MRPYVARLTTALAILVALVTACGPSTPRSGRDRALRATRAGAHRPDAIECHLHGHEDEETARAPGAGLRHIEETDAGNVHSPCPPPAALSAANSPFLVSPVLRVLDAVPPPPPRLLSSFRPHAPDRAPPA